MVINVWLGIVILILVFVANTYRNLWKTTDTKYYELWIQHQHTMDMFYIERAKRLSLQVKLYHKESSTPV